MRTELLPDHDVEGSTILHRLPLAAGGIGDTKLSDEIEGSWQDPRPAKTVVARHSNVINIRPERRTGVARPQPEAAASVRGAVLAVEERSVRCQLEVDGQAVEIALLPDLFPEPPQFGMTFDLSMITISGVQQPSVVLRPAVNSEDDLAIRMRAVLDSF